MILDSIFRIAAFNVRENKTLPRYVYIHRGNFKREYHIREVVALASKVCGLKSSTGTKRPKAAIGIIQKAARVLHSQRTKSTLYGYIDPKIPKVVLGDDIKVLDLRLLSCNTYGLAKVRLRAAMDDNASSIILRPEHRYRAVEVTLEADIIITDTDLESLRLQHFLARANINTIVVTSKDVEGYYTPPPTDEWSVPHVASA